MHDKLVYEYAVIRVMPRVDRGEFVNVGVILFCKRKRFIRMKYHLDEQRLKALFPELDTEEVAEYLNAWELISKGHKDGGPIAQLEVPDRFRWLTAVKSTILQSSRIHPGLCESPEVVLEGLFEKYVT